jgi:lipoate-protein ligase B
MRKIIIENVDMLTSDQEEYLIKTLKDMNLEFKQEKHKCDGVWQNNPECENCVETDICVK